MRQSLRLVLKVKPFKIFTAIHTIHFLICSEGRDFIIEPFFECLPLRLSHCLNLNKVKAVHALLGCERYFNLLSLRFILNLRDLSEWDNTF